MNGRTLARLAQLTVALVAVAIALVRFVAIDSGSHSASDTLRPWAAQILPVVLIAVVVILVVRRFGRWVG